jgi:membrane protein DedA with SNARE-associated domain
MLQDLANQLITFYLAHEFPTLFILLLVEEAGVPLPVPGDTLVALAGTHHGRTPLYTVGVLATASLSVFLGSSILYSVMRRGGRPLLDRYGRYLLLKPERVRRMEGWMNRHGPIAIVWGRLIPGLRIPTSVVAGLSNIPYRVYAPADAISALIWSSVYFWLGMFIYRHFGLIALAISGLVDVASVYTLLLLLLILLIAMAVAFAGGMYLRRRNHQRNGSEAGASGTRTRPPATSVEEPEEAQRH